MPKNVTTIQQSNHGIELNRETCASLVEIDAAELHELPKNKKACSGHSIRYTVNKTTLHDWAPMNRERQSDYIVTCSMIQIQVQLKFHDPSFKASAGWGTNFMRYHNLFLHVDTKIN